MYSFRSAAITAGFDGAADVKDFYTISGSFQIRRLLGGSPEEVSGKSPLYCRRALEILEDVLDVANWLTSMPQIRAALVWQSFGIASAVGPITSQYDQWSATSTKLGEVPPKKFLWKAVKYAWHHSKIQQVAELLPPATTGGFQELITIAWSYDNAWAKYVDRVAYLIFAEMRGSEEWTLSSLGSSALQQMFDSRSRYYLAPKPDMVMSAPAGHAVVGMWSSDGSTYTPSVWSNSVLAYGFVKNSGAVSGTHENTIANLMLYFSNRLFHFQSYIDKPLDSLGKKYSPVEVATNYWGYFGGTPMSRFYTPVAYLNPGGSTDVPGWSLSTYYAPPARWPYRGCGGFPDLMRDVLECLRISCERTPLPAGHSTVYFPSIGKYLSHGDDFMSLSGALKGIDPLKLLISQETFDAWFKEDLQPKKNIARRVRELILTELPTYLLKARCKDKASGGVKIGGQVWATLRLSYNIDLYNDFDFLTFLEDQKLWTKLDAKIDALGGCSLI